MSSLPALNLAELFKGLPRGAWVAASHDGARVVAYGWDLQVVITQAKGKGEDDPLILRVPETANALAL